MAPVFTLKNTCTPNQAASIIHCKPRPKRLVADGSKRKPLPLAVYPEGIDVWLEQHSLVESGALPSQATLRCRCDEMLTGRYRVNRHAGISSGHLHHPAICPRPLPQVRRGSQSDTS